MKNLFLIILMSSIAFSANANDLVRGMNLTELGNFIYDANPRGEKTPAQVAVDQIYDLGARHVVLNPIAKMFDPRGNDLEPAVGPGGRSKERQRYGRLIKYIKSKGMTVGMRPIFFVLKKDGTFPYTEEIDGVTKTWWHGNIQPADPDRWFQSFKSYLDIYVLISKIYKVEEFTIGAELYSMTVGIEDQWDKHKYGFPGKWLSLLRYVRSKLGDKVRIMYDINFTDDSVTTGGDIQALGGELERWRYRLADLAYPENPAEFKIWRNLVDFWNELDAIGIDMYRSLGSKRDDIPEDYEALREYLQIRADEYASQMDITLAEIESVTEKTQMMIFKETGFRSVDYGFIEPFAYETGTGNYNEEHQAAAFEALFKAFWEPEFYWFQGGSLWDVSVSPLRNTGVGDTGFSPVGKPMTTGVLRRLFEFDF